MGSCLTTEISTQAQTDVTLARSGDWLSVVPSEWTGPLMNRTTRDGMLKQAGF